MLNPVIWELFAKTLADNIFVRPALVAGVTKESKVSIHLFVRQCMKVLIIDKYNPPQTVFVGGKYCFHVASPSACPSVMFWFVSASYLAK